LGDESGPYFTTVKEAKFFRVWLPRQSWKVTTAWCEYLLIAFFGILKSVCQKPELSVFWYQWRAIPVANWTVTQMPSVPDRLAWAWMCSIVPMWMTWYQTDT
jgi:hypothetical protein